MLFRSGQSPDLIAYATAAKAGGAKVLALTNSPESPLAHVADCHLYLLAGEERAVAATKSYSAQLLLSLVVASAWSKSAIDFAALIAETTKNVQRGEQIKKIADAFDHAPGVTTLGRGFAYCNAHEAALKIKETLKAPVSSFSSADYLQI